MRSFKHEATKFRIWREGTAIKWRCTYADLARALDMTPNYVRKTCQANGWVCLYEDDKAEVAHRDADHRLPVDKLMSRGELHFHL